jgi:RNA polymerase sigma-70 factor (ECF subfamily)
VRILEYGRPDETGDSERLVADFLARRSEGLESVYRAYGSSLYSVARHILHDDDEAQDCVHDVLLRVWQRPDVYRRERGALRAYLSVAVRNEALTRLRKAARHLRLERSLVAVEPQAYELEASDHVELERLRDALASLASEQRAALQLAYGGHLTHVQIAERLSVPLGTVKSRIALGLRRLRTVLQASPETGR